MSSAFWDNCAHLRFWLLVFNLHFLLNYPSSSLCCRSTHVSPSPPLPLFFSSLERSLMHEGMDTSVATNTRWDSYWRASQKFLGLTDTKLFTSSFYLIGFMKDISWFYSVACTVLGFHRMFWPVEAYCTFKIIMLDMLYLPFPDLAKGSA